MTTTPLAQAFSRSADVLPSRSNAVFGRSIVLLLFCAFTVPALSGCARLEKVGGIRGAIELMLADLRDLRAVLLGAPNPKIPKSAAERAHEANAELLSELFQVVLLRPPLDEAEFGVFLSPLNQGGSLEGVYNGFTHSAKYRDKEIKSGPASAEAVKAFAELMLEFQGALGKPTVFEPSMAQPLAEIDPMSESAGVNELNFGQKSDSASSGSSNDSVTPGDIARLFERASLFTLKRVVGDEALKVITHRQERGDLVRWYGTFAAQQAAKGVDFGLALRNKADSEFHSQWAEGMLGQGQQDRLTWEVLNRVHRVINHAEWVSRKGEAK